MSELTRTRLAKGMCLAAAMIWGAAFFMMKEATDVMPVFWLLGVRFTLAAALMGLIFWKRWKGFDLGTLWRGGVIGLFLFAAYVTQTFGLKYTTPSNNAFITATYCVMVPFLTWIAMGVRPDRWNLLAAVLCVVGLALVSLTDALTIGLGDSLSLLCALFFAGQIVAINKLAQGRDVVLLTVVQLATLGVLSLLCALLFQTPPSLSVFTPKVLLEFVYMIVLATIVSDLFQNVGQVWTDPNSASILLSMESVFGVLFSVLFYGDPLTPRLLLGFGIIFLAVLCSETKLAFLRKNPREREEEPS